MNYMTWEEVYRGKQCYFRYDDCISAVVICDYDNDSREVKFFTVETAHDPQYEGDGVSKWEKFDGEGRFLVLE